MLMSSVYQVPCLLHHGHNIGSTGMSRLCVGRKNNILTTADVWFALTLCSLPSYHFFTFGTSEQGQCGRMTWSMGKNAVSINPAARNKKKSDVTSAFLKSWAIFIQKRSGRLPKKGPVFYCFHVYHISDDISFKCLTSFVWKMTQTNNWLLK